MKKFIAVEGLDGSGKSTQIELLRICLEKSDRPCASLHFPRTGQGVYGELIARFLRGEMGPAGAVDPYLVALIYAGDRNDAKPLLQRWMEEGTTVIADRYVYSNIAYQCAKIDDPSGKEKLEDWIIRLEYGINRIPKPDISIFLSAPMSFVERKLSESRNGNDRAYLEGKRDIHEGSLSLQKKVEREYRRLSEKYDDLILVDCAAYDGSVLSPEKIHAAIDSLIR